MDRGSKGKVQLCILEMFFESVVSGYYYRKESVRSSRAVNGKIEWMMIFVGWIIADCLFLKK